MECETARGRMDRLSPNAWLVARREFRERVASRLFVLSTLLLAGLAIGTALMPLLLRSLERDTTSTIAILAADDATASRTISILGGILNAGRVGGDPSRPPAYAFVRANDPATIRDEVAAGRYDAALEVRRDASGRLDFRFLSGPSFGADRAQLVGVGTLAVAILDWTAENGGGGSRPFVMPTLDLATAAGPGAGAMSAAEFASRRIVGVVFVVLIFITLVIYGMWVAAGVVAEKSSRVMELLISAASPAQLVVGKVAGIGLAGLVQYVGIVAPAIVTLLLEERIAAAVLGTPGSLGIDLAIVSPALLAAYGAFWVLGFILYALLYAAAGSLVSRAEDLQVLALPLSVVAIAGYLIAVGALTGGISSFVRIASLVPFWSPFIMLTRLTVGRAEPWEVAAAYALLVAAIALVGVVAVRIYAAGVLLYGQRPGFRAIVGAVLRPPA